MFDLKYNFIFEKERYYTIMYRNIQNPFVKCVLYYGLPQFPDSCYFKFNSKLFLRDMFGCCAGNIYHYEYPKFQNFTYDEGCNGRGSMNSIIKHLKNKRPCYLMLRVRYIDLMGNKQQFAVGYFKVAHTFQIKSKLLKSDGLIKGIQAEEVVLLNKKNAISWNLSPRGCHTSDGPRRNEVLEIFKELNSHLNKKSNVSLEYKRKTIRMMQKLRNPTECDKIMDYCLNECPEKKCRLKKKFTSTKKNNDSNYLKYLYHDNVYLTNIIENLKENENRIEYDV